MGILVSFSVCLCSRQIINFSFLFLGGMIATWLCNQGSKPPGCCLGYYTLALGLILIWAAMSLLAYVPMIEMPVLEGLAVVINALLSLILLFAVSPVLEMAFGYSTRFRLMELMSLEQPLMQEIMVTIPGTYHHSLVVANMVEAGARAIGANSLLCKSCCPSIMMRES